MEWFKINSALIEFSKTQSLIIYILTYAMSMFFVWLHTKYKRNNVLIKIIVFFGIVLPIILLECLRYDVGTKEFYKQVDGHNRTKEELKNMAENILSEIKNGPPFVYS